MPITSAGYIYEKNPLHPLASERGVVLQHRRVWFDANGAIPDGGVIHHINGDKTDNRLENLELCDRSSHMKEHYPDGFCSDPWNKGKTEYSNVTCQECGIGFVRLAKEVRKTIKRGSRVLCSNQCGRSKGWTLLKSGKYQAQHKGKYLGVFLTQEEAEAAFDRARGAAMTAKTQQCDECEHWDETLAAYLLPPCGIGHKPRFYYSQLDKAGRIPGWKRRCDDFKEKRDER